MWITDVFCGNLFKKFFFISKWLNSNVFLLFLQILPNVPLAKFLRVSYA